MSDLCSPISVHQHKLAVQLFVFWRGGGWGIHISLAAILEGVHMSLVICVRGYTYHGGTHITARAEPLIVSAEKFHDIFGSSDEENNAADFDESDNDVQEVDSDIEEDENESDNDLNASDTIVWSDELEDFDIDEFSGQQAIKFNVPENVSPNDFFSQLFGDSVIDTIGVETNRYARQKLADTPRLEKWKDITNRELKA